MKRWTTGTYVSYVLHRERRRAKGPMRSQLTLGERIVTARRRAGVTQKDIAVRCDTTRQQVGKWEKGIAVPDVVELLKLADYTRLPLEFFTADLLIDLSDQPDTQRSCSAGYWFDLPKLFDDSGFVQTDDNRMGEMRQNESMALYAISA
jgi:transcriptional regulator with XRE-family HTH domain